MQNPFDQLFERLPTSSTKWRKYAGTDVLPFWVADMDMATPPFILDAVRERLEHPILGYTDIPEALTAAACGWLERRYGWRVPPVSLLWLPGVVPGLNLATRALVSTQQAIVVPTPVYHPFHDVAGNAGCAASYPLLRRDGDRWVMDLDAFAASLPDGARMLLLCNPQNPTGRAYTRDELLALGEFCLQHDLLLCADEIHCELLLEPHAVHTPIASLSPELAARTISLYAPTKTFNMPGLGCAFAVVPNASLRRQLLGARGGLLHSTGALSYAAATAALNYDGSWVNELCTYLRGNRQRLQAVVDRHLPGAMTAVEATYLAWIDLREPVAGKTPAINPAAFFEDHGLGLSDGADFGLPGFVRFNFGAPRPLLEQGLTRLDAALAALLNR